MKLGFGGRECPKLEEFLPQTTQKVNACCLQALLTAFCGMRHVRVWFKETFADQ
jgi:hypothetical protein